jgi:hypothetical protein
VQQPQLIRVIQETVVTYAHYGQVGAAAVCKHGNEWRSRRSILCTRRMEVFDAEVWAIALVLNVAIEKRDTLQKHGVKMVAVFSDSQAAI